MRSKLIISFFLIQLCCIFNYNQCIGQNAIDTLLAKKITVAGICLCQTTIQDLGEAVNHLQPTELEEMDAGKKCIGEDARYENGKGYYSEKYPGMIFQKGRDDNYVSKIRLTKDFIGRLPDGISIDMHHLLLKDIIKNYPDPAFKWSSRGCSDFWNYTNDTLSFFFKIDRDKKPQYPLDEAYYLNRPVDGIDLVISCYNIYNKDQDLKLFGDDEPMFFIDSIRTNQAFLNNFQPNEIACVNVYKDSNAIAVAGKDAKNGAIFIFTKSFAREAYWQYFRSKSADYKKEVPDLKTESKVVYILNDKILDTNFEGDLFNINDTNFLHLDVIDKTKLRNDYKVKGKMIGVVIKTRLKH